MFNEYMKYAQHDIFFECSPTGLITVKAYDSRLDFNADYIYKNKFIDYSLDEIIDIVKNFIDERG
jgi:hypothetical protein